MVMSCVTRAIGLAPLNAVVFSMVGDVVEFGQLKNHIRQESLIFAGGSYSWSAWATGYFVSCLPGIIIQLILIPIIYVALERAHLLPVRYPAVSVSAETEAALYKERHAPPGTPRKKWLFCLTTGEPYSVCKFV